MHHTGDSLYGPTIFDLEVANELLCIQCKHCCHGISKSLRQMRAEDQLACPRCHKSYLREAITAFAEQIIEALST